MILQLHFLQVLGLPRDVEVVGSGLHAGLHHGLAIEPVGADTVEDDTGLLCHLEEGGGVAAVTYDQGNWGGNTVNINS